jgi:hypothetical protein
MPQSFEGQSSAAAAKIKMKSPFTIGVGGFKGSGSYITEGAEGVGVVTPQGSSFLDLNRMLFRW